MIGRWRAAFRASEFVGRRRELTTLLDAFERAAMGEFAAIFLAGDSGVGKSRLLRQLARVAHERGAHVLAGDCLSLAEGELPYAPIRSVLRTLAREFDPEALEELLGSGRYELARLVPELAATVAPAPATGGEPLAQALLFDQLLGLLARRAEDAPVVLAIEDIHWADRSTRDFLAFLIANARRERLLLVCSYRTDVLHRGHALRQFLAQHERPPAVERVDLRLFTEEELGEQLCGILEAEPDAAARSPPARAHRRKRVLHRGAPGGRRGQRRASGQSSRRPHSSDPGAARAGPGRIALRRGARPPGDPSPAGCSLGTAGARESLARRGRLSIPGDATAGKPDASGPVERLGLTERELAVLELVARGMTNRQIGEQLFMAPKTASVHVSRILTKLEVSSRLEAATAAQRLGLVP
jgi:DNA-binding CsgD family transcriptional regulator